MTFLTFRAITRLALGAIFVGSVEVNAVFEFHSFVHSVFDCGFES